MLTHLENKNELLQECHRLLKKDGIFVITDWLSAETKEWGPHVSKLIELEHLALFPESKSGYLELLQKNGFTLLSVRDDSLAYLRFNQAICEKLQAAILSKTLSDIFDEKELQASIDGYQSIAKALEMGELKVFRFVGQKNF